MTKIESEQAKGHSRAKQGKTERVAPGSRSRLAQALGKIRAEAARALENEPRPRRARPPAVADALSGPFLADGLSADERRNLCEVADDTGRLLICMPPRSALRQKLPLRLVLCVVRTDKGRRVLLHKQTGQEHKFSGLWGMYAGYIRPGEAGKDGAIRLLAQAGIEGPVPHLAGEAACGHGVQGLPGPVLLYTVDVPHGLYPEAARHAMLEVDADELAALMERSPELLTPALHWAAGAGLLFSKT